MVGLAGVLTRGGDPEGAEALHREAGDAGWAAEASYVPGDLLEGKGDIAGARAVWPRAGQLTAQAVFGTVDEIVASPRLLPVLLLELLWLFGHDPERPAAWRALSARAIANGNPALDYIGTGGPTPLRAQV
jgi:hypothetical protein